MNEIEIKDSDRPICSCGVKMKLVHYEHYYGKVSFWDCYNSDCNISKNLSKYKSDHDIYEGC